MDESEIYSAIVELRDSHYLSGNYYDGSESIDGVARLFDANIQISVNGRFVNIKSPEEAARILGIHIDHDPIRLMSGDEVCINSSGPEARDALNAMITVLSGKKREVSPIWHQWYKMKLEAGTVIVGTATIANRLGIHARTSAQIATLARSFDAEILLEARGQLIWSRSIMSVMMLPLSKGENLQVVALGENCVAAHAAMTSLISGGFGEE